MAVHSRDYYIQRSKHVVRQIESSVFQNIDLDALEQRDASVVAVECIDLPTLFGQSRRIQTVCHGKPPRMFGDGDVLVASCDIRLSDMRARMQPCE